MREGPKPVVWMGDSLKRLKAFSKPVRQQAGYELELVQHDLEPSDWKPIAAIGHAVSEIRIHTDGEHRVIYVAKFRQAVYVLHAFRKKSRKTPKPDIDLARTRLEDALRMEARNK